MGKISTGLSIAAIDAKSLHDLKLIAAVAVFVGTSLQMLANRFGPLRLVLEEKPKVLGWARTLGSWITLTAGGGIVVLELLTPIG